MKGIRIATRRTAIVLIAATVLASSAMAQPRGNARLTGKVVDEKGQPLENALVTAQMTGQSDMLSGKTDKKGEWRINGAANGEWKVQVSREGLASVTETLEVKDSSREPTPRKTTCRRLSSTSKSTSIRNRTTSS